MKNSKLSERIEREEASKLRQVGQIKMCPACQHEYTGFPALSRRDNKTDICSNCGVREAMEDYARSINAKNK